MLPRLVRAIAVALAVLLPSAATLADVPNQGTAAERAALAPEDTSQPLTASDLTAPIGAERFTGKPIVRVEAVTVGRLWASQQVISSVRAGEPFSGDAARRALREALATGKFARAGIEAYAADGGVVLRLALLPRRTIASLTLSGGSLDRGETLETAALSEGGEVTVTALDTARERITKLYADHGFPAAIVRIDATDTDDPSRAVVSIEIEPGAPLIIESRVFVLEPELVAEVGNLRKRYKIDPSSNPFEALLARVGFDIQPSTRADETLLADADRELADVLRQNGFPRAEVSHTLVPKGARVELRVRLMPGPRLVPVFDGNRAFDADQLAAALELSKGDASRPAELEDRLRVFYVKRGFLDVEVNVTERGGPADPVHYLTFRIRENRRVRVVRRLFPCLTGELSAEYIGGEIQTFLEEDLPRSDGFSAGDPRALLPVFGPQAGAGNRPAPLDINPATTFAPEPYERALKHLRDLYYSKGYLNAIVGPVSLLRARCDPKRSGEVCVAEELPRIPPRCEKDELGLPLPEPALPEAHRCTPDPARGLECAPEVTVVIPIHPGPRSLLYDLAFEGNRQVPSQRLARIADLPLGEPVSLLDLEAARLRLLDFYQARGHFYADVRATVEPSPDRTRGRAKFSIAENEIVRVAPTADFVVKGARLTDVDLIRSRVALVKGQPYRQDLARLSEERIAALGPFRSVSVGLEDPDVPQREKRVVITVVEQLPQYLDPKIGFSTGEGFRFAFEYGNRNLAGRAVSLLLRVQLGYLPDVLILDDEVRAVYTAETPLNPKAPLNNIGYRLERRNAASLSFPDIGLGPGFSLSIDGIDLKDLQRDYGLSKQALTPTLTFRNAWRVRDGRTWLPRQIGVQGGLSVELNDVQILSESAADATIRFLRVPVGQTVAFAERTSITYDARNNPFSATSGILLAAGLEHVTALPTDSDSPESELGDFLRITGKANGYIPLGIEGFSVAMSASGGGNWEILGNTYPDRLFFLGGVDSIRSFLADSVVPQDIADCITGDLDSPACFLTDDDGQQRRITIDDVSIRGGNLSLNTRLELRFPLPVSSFLSGGLFLDAGNVWKDPRSIAFKARLGVGLGLRIATPIGPIAFDYGFNVVRYAWEDLGAFHFSIGLF